MNFLHPMLLLASAGIALPILAHLLNRYRVRRTDWAAMQFLNRDIRVRSRQLRLRDLILLLLRCLAILLLVFALAGPSIDHPAGLVAAMGEPRPGIVLAIDASYSMSHVQAGRSRFDHAIDKARRIVSTPSPGTPVSLVLLGDEPRVVARNMAFIPGRFEAMLRDLQPTEGRLRWEAVPAALNDLVAALPSTQKKLYLITDLQRTDWLNTPRWLADALGHLGQQAHTFIVPVQGADDNLAVTDFSLFSGLLRKGTTARYSATVHNFGSTAATNVRVDGLMDQSVVDSKIIPQISPGTSQTVSFFVPFQNAGPVTLSATLEDKALVVDNTRRAVANIRDRVSILCVEGGSASGSGPSFLVKALKSRGRDAGKEDYNMQTVSWLSLPGQDLSRFDVVVLSNVPEIAPEQAEQLAAHVRKGGGLIWFAGDQVKADVWNKMAKLKTGSLLPARITTAGTRAEQGSGQPLDPVFPDHPVCRPLRSLPKDLLSETLFQQVLGVEPLPGSFTVLKLSGRDAPVLLEQSLGRGHVFMCTTSADTSWNNMALTPVFPLMLQQMVTYLTAREFEESRTVGQSLSLSYVERPDANDGIFEKPSGQVVRVPVREHSGEYVAVLDQARQSGIYWARVNPQQPGQPIAVNVDVRESDVGCADPAAVGQRLAETGVTMLGLGEDPAASAATGRNFGRSLLIAALVMFFIESLLASNLFARRRRHDVADGVPPTFTPAGEAA